MAKKIFTILLVISLFCFVTIPAYAETEDEKDKRQARAVLAAIGVVALVGTLYMLHKWNSSFTETFLNERESEDKKLRLTLDFDSIGSLPDVYNGENKQFNPTLKFKYSW